MSAQPFSNRSDSGWTTTVRIGDLIRFGYQGRSYMLLGNSPLPNSNRSVADPLSDTTGQHHCRPASIRPVSPGTPCVPLGDRWLGHTAAGHPAGHRRRPLSDFPPAGQVGRAAAAIARGNRDRSIDLHRTDRPSGSVRALSGGSPLLNPIITFGPTGAANLVYYDNNLPQHLLGALYLLVGRREGMEDVNLRHRSEEPAKHSRHQQHVGGGRSTQRPGHYRREHAGCLRHHARQYAEAGVEHRRPLT